MSASDGKLKLERFLRVAIECSIYHSPLEPGLNYDEIIEIGRRVNLQAGEIGDALRRTEDRYVFGAGNYLLPGPNDAMLLLHFTQRDVPDYRNPQAFDFVFDQLRNLERSEGERQARIERRVLVDRAVAAGLDRSDIEAATTIMLLGGILREEQGIVSFVPGRGQYASPGLQIRQRADRHTPTVHNEMRAQVYLIVKDVISRRRDGRPQHAEPLDAFAEALERLEYGKFRLWWSQIVAEFRQASPQTSPVAATVLAAALVEGALTFVVKHARMQNLGVMGSKTFEGSPTSWRIDDLVASAASGRDAAILDSAMRQRAEALIRSRQRIHAGRMLSEFPGGPPDLKPDEAREAHTTAEQVVRRVLEWLQRYP